MPALTAENEDALSFLKKLAAPNAVKLYLSKENLGVDIIMELNPDSPTRKNIGLYIKSGDYYNNSFCFIPVADHETYWRECPFPVIAIVYDASQNHANWIDIQKYLKENENVSVIKIVPDAYNTLTPDTFSRIFLPLAGNRLPKYSLEEAIEIFNGPPCKESELALKALFKSYRNKKVVWKIFLEHLARDKVKQISYALIHYIAHIPGHMDLPPADEKIAPEILEFAKSTIRKYDENIILKLLNVIPPGEFIDRGTAGQSVEAIISLIDNFTQKLELIIRTRDTNSHIKILASQILAYHAPEKAATVLGKVHGIHEIGFIRDSLVKFTKYDLYG